MIEGQLRIWLDRVAGVGGSVSALEVAILRRGEVVFRKTAGWRVGGERLKEGCRFDAASLTKPWMATLALALDRRGDLALGLELGEIYPGTAERLAPRTLEDLLRHRSTLPAWAPLALGLGRRHAEREALEALLTGGRLALPATEAGTYSDLGYLLWGLAAERVTNVGLADLLDRHVAGPLGLAPIGALAAAPPDPVECRLDNGREVELAGEQGFDLERRQLRFEGRPQDGNARLLGRLSGHAGLFLTIDEQLALGREWLAPERVLDETQVGTALAGGTGWGLGWAHASADGSSGPTLSPAAYGHAGFTGGSLWLDPERELAVALLAHRLSSATDFNPVRRELHRLAAELLDELPG